MNDAVPQTEVKPNQPELTAPSALPPEEIDRLTDDIIAALKTVYDPEIPSDIYELGLIYRIAINDDRHVEIDMTLTAPGCPVAGEMPGWVDTAVSTVPGVRMRSANISAKYRLPKSILRSIGRYGRYLMNGSITLHWMSNS